MGATVKYGFDSFYLTDEEVKNLRKILKKANNDRDSFGLHTRALADKMNKKFKEVL